MRFDDFTSEDVGNIIMDRIEPSTHRHYYRSSRENAVHDSTAHLSSSPSNSYDTTAGNQDSSALFTSASRLPAPTYRRQPQTRKHLRNHNRFRLPTRHFQHRLGLKLNQQRYHRNRRLRVSGGGKYRQPVKYSRGRPSPLQEPQQPSSQERPQRPSDISRLPINITPTSAAPQTSGSVEVIEDNDGRVFIESGIEQNPIPVLTNNVVRNKTTFRRGRQVRQFDGLIDQLTQLISDSETLRTVLTTLGSTASTVLGMLSDHSDLLTALSIIAQLEARTKYDPRFRESIPSLAKRNLWLM